MEPEISDRIQSMLNQIRSCNSPVPMLQDRTGGSHSIRKLRVYELYVQGLNETTRKSLETAMIGIQGVVSLVVDTQHQRITTRVTADITPMMIAEEIVKETSMQMMLIKRNALKQEVFLNLLGTPEERGDGIDMPCYLPEDDSPPRGDQVLSTAQKKRPIPISVFRWITNKWQKSFYW